MKYMGSKNSIAKYILPFLHKFKNRKNFFDVFVGGANIIDKCEFENKFGFDKNKYLIALLKHLANGGELLDSLTEEDYYEVKNNKNLFDDWEVGFVGFCASYGGKFFNGFPRGKNHDGSPRDYTNEAVRNLRNQQQYLAGIEFDCFDYKDLNFFDCICCIYCDPPYFGTTQYNAGLLGKFNHNEFWDWVDRESESNPVFISEYTAPKHYKVLWKKTLKSNLKLNGVKISEEKLFIHEKWFDLCNK